MISGNNGVLTKATDAKKANEKGIENDKMSLAKQEALVEGYSTSSGMTLDDLNTALGTSLTENQYKGNVKKVVDGVPIPTGFVYVEGTKKDDGLIVVDKYGNEFVWVPIVSGAETTNTSVWSEPGNVDGDEDYITGWTEDLLEDEYKSMKTSVATYKGFYVGRYETSWTGTQVASVGNVNPWNNQTWYTFYEKSKKLHNDSVISSMIYNSQWNAIMKWMDVVINPNVEGNVKYIANSIGMGNYMWNSDFTDYRTDGLIMTGSNDNYKVKNIYDLAGNVCEWTQKADTQWNRLTRGGYCEEDNGANEHVASGAPDGGPLGSAVKYGSRISLYIK